VLGDEALVRGMDDVGAERLDSVEVGADREVEVAGATGVGPSVARSWDLPGSAAAPLERRELTALVPGFQRNIPWWNWCVLRSADAS
jgi:hypothetical protein